jgi:aspartate-semialdehyde dehydrogenase
MMSRERIPVAVLGATGTVGQRFLQMLADHPWFVVSVVTGSGRRAGQRLGDALTWHLPGDPPAHVLDLPLHSSESAFDAPIVFSALPADEAATIEPLLAGRGHAVFSNASAHRMATDVPLLIPEVNAGHVALVQVQQRARGWRGMLVTNPNCSTIQIALALKPLADAFGLRRVAVTTLQAISGAGYPGVASYDILGNVVPYISQEEEKIERETRKILGRLNGESIEPLEIAISAQCTRVPVREGHLACISVELAREGVTSDEIVAALRAFTAEPQKRELPTAPRPVIHVRDAIDRPQPLRDVDAGAGMAIVAGRVRPCALLGHKLVVLGHNTIRGAAGASILNAELLLARGLLPA